MNNKNGKILNTTANGYNIRVTPKTMEQLKKIKAYQADTNGINLPFSAIVGKLVYNEVAKIETAYDGSLLD